MHVRWHPNEGVSGCWESAGGMNAWSMIEGEVAPEPADVVLTGVGLPRIAAGEAGVGLTLAEQAGPGCQPSSSKVLRFTWTGVCWSRR